MKFHLLTIFPDIFDSYINESILKRAQAKKIIKFKIHNLRDWTKDKHKTVDDTPYGGGAGMLMKIEPLYQALQAIKKLDKKIKPTKRKIILLSASGKKWTQAQAQKYSKLEEIIFICGRYEGVDARIKKFINLNKEFDADELELTRNRKMRRGFIAQRYASLVQAIYNNQKEISLETQVTYGDGRTGCLKTSLQIKEVESK